MTDAAISAPAASPSSGGVDDELRRMLGERTARATAYGASFVALWEAAADTLLGGKMLRPRLLLAAYDALTESLDAAAARASVVRIAAAVEVLHFAFLLHDDVIDGDLQRRGRPNLIGTLLNQRAGLRTHDDAHWARTNALLLGDVLLSDAHQILAREDLPTAASEFAAALGNGLDDSRIHYALARTLRRSGKPEEAEQHLRLFRERKSAEQTEAQP